MTSKMNEFAVWGYLVIWEFRVEAAMAAQFEAAYGPKGAWTRLFSQGDGYIATQLIRDLNDSSRYLTLDFWTSRQAYEQFRSAHRVEYEQVDQECESLTTAEVPLGAFSRP
jgi:heme-degrading monooxygenase HmoA